MNATVEKHMQIAQDKAKRLEELAAARGTSENALFEEALDLLFRAKETEAAIQVGWELLQQLEGELGPVPSSTVPPIRPEDTVFLGGTPLSPERIRR
jgi:hypothetical protein